MTAAAEIKVTDKIVSAVCASLVGCMCDGRKTGDPCPACWDDATPEDRNSALLATRAALVASGEERP